MCACKSDQIKNPKSGRCVSRSGVIGKKILREQNEKSNIKPCGDKNQIRNPKSGRCVSRSGAIGKKILREQHEKSNIKPCGDKNQIRNPKSGRCVSRSGAIGKKILSEKSQSPEKTPNKNCKRRCDSDKICNKKTGRCVSITGIIGKQIVKDNRSTSISPQKRTRNSSLSKGFCANDRVIVGNKPGVVLHKTYNDSSITYSIKFDNIEEIKTNVPSDIVNSEDEIITKIIIDNGGLQIVTKKMLRNILKDKGIIYRKSLFNDIIVNIVSNISI